MSKIIWKDIDSATIKGLIICELPPITKPKMRVQETKIDGVDGSIIEDLGYESYDKSLKIGLTKDFDIDEVIQYFSGEGTIVFSNEPNKYYNAKIINQINYEKLLRFKEAEVKFRVQPFKYEVNEETMVLPTGSIEGNSVKINDSKLTQLKVFGNSAQETSEISYPNQIKSIGYENLFEEEILSNYSNYTEQLGNNYMGYKKQLKPNTFYTINVFNKGWIGSGGWIYRIYNSSNILLGTLQNVSLDDDVVINFSTDDTGIIYFANLYCNQERLNNWFNAVDILLFEGVKEHSYIPYNKYGIKVKTLGKNKLKGLSTPLKDINYWGTITLPYFTPLEDGWGRFEYDNTNGTSTVFINAMVKLGAINLKINKKYTIVTEIRNSNISENSGAYFQIFTNSLTSAWQIGKTIAYSDVNQGGVFKVTSTTKESFDGVVNALDTYLRLSAGTKGTVEIRISIFEEDADIANFEYEEYKTSSLLLELNEPLRSLPNDVKDVAYIRDNKLYVDKKIKSIILNGTENWLRVNTFDGTDYIGFSYQLSDVLVDNVEPFGYMCDMFECIGATGWARAFEHIVVMNDGRILVAISRNKLISEDVVGFKTWLSENNTQFNYELKTPIIEEYGVFNILELLDSENNISNSENALMLLDYVDNKLIVDNLGNCISKPIFELEGSGTIKFILNGYSVFNYNFDNDGKVIIDSEKEDAYLENILKNRNMNGEFPKLETGKNVITWDGLIKAIKIRKKSRWL